MPQPLKVLIVEESSDDAELLVQELRRAGFEPDWQRVNTEAEYLDRLQSGINLVLSNYETPQFSGLRALELLREGGLDIPFIVVSGTMGEDTAVKAMKHGASDYLIKNQLERLGQSVSQALDSGRQRAERKRIEQQLLLQGIALETAANAIVITDAAGIILWVNPAFTAQSGYSAKEAVGATPRLLKSGKHEPKFYEELWTTVLAGKTWRGCFTNRRKDGSLYFDEHTITPVRAKDGAVTHFVAIMNDVTERRSAEDALRSTHAQLRELLDHSPAVLYALKVEGEKITPYLASANITRLLGFEIAETLSMEWWLGRQHPDDRERVMASIAETISSGTSRTEYRMRHKDGSYRWVEDSRRLVRAEPGQPAELVIVWTDITSRKRTETERERFFTLSPDLLCIAGFDGRFQRVNPAFERILGFTEREMCEEQFFKFVHPDDRAATMAEVARLATGAPTLNFENRYRCKDGSYRHLSWTATPFLEDNTFYAVGRDVTERQLAETALRSSEERFRQVVENIHEVFWMTDVENAQVLYVSPAYEAIWGRSRESLYASRHGWSENVHAEDRDRVLAAAAKQATGGYDETYRIVRPDGALRWVRARTFPVRDQAGRVFRVVGTAEDITVSKQAALRLKLQLAVTSVLAEEVSSTEINLKILETLCRGLQWEFGELWTVDRAAQVLRCSEIWHLPSAKFKAFAAETRKLSFAIGQGLPGSVWASGGSEFSQDVAQDARSLRGTQAARLGMSGWIGFPIKVRKEILGVVGFFSTRMQLPDPEALAMFNAFGAQIGLLVERRQMAEQFRQAQKMEAIGTLAGGIAHDFNNVLAVINGYTELVKMEFASSPRVSEYLGAVLQGTKRATDLVRQILAFSRQQDLERKPLQLRLEVGEALKLLRATIPATIEFETSLAFDTPNVLADATQIHQIVMNLCTNAAHAMKERPGRLTVTLENFEVDAELAASQPALRKGPYVRLTISDTGHGMDASTLARIFEPFFTTKALGEGTGLGLAVVHGIMQSHEGAITVYSHQGEGTTFRLYFPPHFSGEIETVVKAATVPRGQGERILYVDDESLLATMGKKILERLGYVVDAQTSATEALAAVRAQPQAYDLVITDQMMPGLAGTRLAEQLRVIRADLPIILTTGYSATLTAERVRELGIQKLLLKPLSVQELGSAVRSVLNESKRG